MISNIIALGVFINEYGPTIISLVMALHIPALFIVNLTKTPKDNEALARFYGAIQVIAGQITKKSTR